MMPLAQNAIPQLVVQEVFTPQGNNNNVKQIINQDLIVYVLEIPDLENVAGISQHIQTNDDIGQNNQVSQNTLQTLSDFPIFPNNYSLSSSEALNNSVSLDFNEFINKDGVLDAVQFSNQKVLVEGNNNSLDLSAEQIVYDLSWYDRYGFDADYVFDESITFDDFLEDFAGNNLIDSVQVGVQDIILFGDGNDVIQQLDQTLATFIFVNEDSAIELQDESSDLSPTQFVFQESFLDTNNNNVEQIINQNIQLDFSFSEESSDQFGELTGELLSDPDFNIDDFIVPILDNTLATSPLFENHEILANQNNLQNLDILGNDNTDVKDSSQIVVLGESDTQELVSGTPHDDTFIVGLTDNFDGLQDLVLLGQGDDLVDLSNSFVDLNIAPFLIPTNTTVRGEEGNDQIIAYKGDEIFGGSGNDLLKTAEGGGENLLDGGNGNDTIIAGINDTILGNKGNDTLIGNDSNDTLDGGPGSDRMVGGGGNDTYHVDNSSDQVVEAFNRGKDLVLSSINYTLPDNVEDLTLTGNGNFEGRGNNLDNVIEVQDGDNSLFGHGGNDRFILAGGINVVDGGEGIDTVQINQTQADAGGVSQNGNLVKIGTDHTLVNGEFIEFSDVRLAADTLLITPIISLNKQAIFLPEGNNGSTNATFTINLSSATTQDVVIDYSSLSDGDAQVDTDFILTTGQLTIAPGDTSADITIEILGDSDVEDDELVFLDLDIVSGATFSDNTLTQTAEVNIEDDDAAISVAIVVDPTVREGNPDNPSTLTFTLDRFGNLQEADTIEIEVIAAGNNPVQASDLVDGFSSRQVTFEAGEDTKTIDIEINPDLVEEQDETFGVRLGSVSGSASVPNEDTVFTILNDDQNPLDTTLNRFQNSLVPGTYLFATEQESQSIRANFPNFLEEGIAFYAYGAHSNQANAFHRFQNSLVPGTFLFATAGESQSIRANFPNFLEEGIAFEAQ